MPFSKRASSRAPVDRGAELETTTKTEETPFHIACSTDSVELVAMLLSKNANPFARNSLNFTPLHFACRGGNLELLRFVLQIPGTDINVPTIIGVTPLYVAVARNHLHIIRFLMEEGADSEVGNVDGVTPLHMASRAAKYQEVLVLLQFGANPMAKDHLGYTPIYNACGHNLIDMVKAFLDHETGGASLLEMTTNQHWTPLHLACDAGNPDIVGLLLARGANLEARAKRDQRALHIACARGHLDVIQLLLDRGAEVEEVDSEQNTPLGMAAHGNHVDSVRLLLERGADLMVVEQTQRLSLLDVACRVGGWEVAQLALDRSCIVESPSSNGQLHPLFEAGSHNHVDIVWILVKRYPWMIDGPRLNTY